MRLFVAIELSDTMKDSLCGVIDHLQSHNISGKFSDRENLHLTLAFIGERDRTEDIIGAIESVSASSFELILDGFGFFGDLLWAGVAKNEQLEKLADDLTSALNYRGIYIEPRAFVPHITLVRRMQQKQSSLPIRIDGARMLVRSISLMRSDRIDGKAVYSNVYTRMI